MTWLRKNALRAFGYLLLAYGSISLATDYVSHSNFGFPFNLGITLGSGAIALLGLVTISVTAALRKIEERVEALEKRRQ
jgi:hypothetical protein